MGIWEQEGQDGPSLLTWVFEVICFLLDWIIYFVKTANYPITRRQILDSSTLKELADDNFKFNENCRKFSKWVENSVGKGEIARYEQFLLFPQCFQKARFPGASKGVIV